MKSLKYASTLVLTYRNNVRSPWHIVQQTGTAEKNMSVQISCKSVQKLLRKVANRQTDKQQTDRLTNNDDCIYAYRPIFAYVCVCV